MDINFCAHERKTAVESGNGFKCQQFMASQRKDVLNQSIYGIILDIIINLMNIHHNQSIQPSWLYTYLY